MLSFIEQALFQVVEAFNKCKPLNVAEAPRKSFKACFVRQGEKKKEGCLKT